MDGQWEDKVAFLVVEVGKVVFPFLLNHLGADESVRVGRVFDEHQRWEIVQLAC